MAFNYRYSQAEHYQLCLDLRRITDKQSEYVWLIGILWYNPQIIAYALLCA